MAMALGGLAWAEEINVIEAGPHHRVMQVIREELDPSGETKLIPHQWQELATGLNRWDDATQAHVPAEVEWEPLDTGHVIARKTAHQLILSPQLGAEGAVELWGPDNLYLRSTILGIGVVDSVTGTNFLLATVKEKAELEVVSGSEVLIRDAFDTLVGDLRYSIGLNRFEQDLILREHVTPELLADLGINPKNAQLFLMTEFFQPPQPQTKESAVATTSGKTLADTTLDFGSMSIGAGRAFSDEDSPLDSAAASAVQPSVGVGKEWKVLDGRQFLIETVQYEDLAPILEKLPILDQARADTIKDRVRRTASLPKTKTLRQAHAPRFDHGRMVLGSAKVADVSRKLEGIVAARTAGAVIDYSIVNSSATLTLTGNMTWYVLGTVNVSSSLVIEGGAVIKYTNGANASLVCNGTVTCQTDPYRPAVFTSKDDNTVGESVPGSTGNPWTNYCASTALQLNTTGITAPLQWLRFAHAQTGLAIGTSNPSAPGTNTLRHAQFIHCQTGLSASGTYYMGQNYRKVLYAGNLLFQGVATALNGYELDATAEHWTVDGAATLASMSGPGMNTLALRNAVLASVTSQGSGYSLSAAYNGFYATTPTGSNTYTNASNPFQVIGAGAHYLGSGSGFRSVGTTGIEATLASDLKALTTYAPALVYSGVRLSTNLVLGPQVARNTGTPDLGYHYAPVDVAASGLAVTNSATLVLTNGVVVAAFGDSGLVLENGGALVAQGSPLAPVRIMRYPAVQELSTNWGNAQYQPNAVVGPGHDYVGPAPTVSLRFVRFDGLGNYGHHIYGGNGWFLFGSMNIRDCEFRN